MSVVINLKTDPKVKDEAKKIASQMGLTLSAVLNAYLRQFIQTKTLKISLPSEIPLQKEIMWLKEGEEALKNGMRYTDVDELISDVLK